MYYVRGIKRKADGMNISVPTTQPVIPAATAVLTVPSDLIQPLYCKLCSVSLNSSQQAMAHYQGKNHGKKVRQYLQKQGQVLLQVHLQAQQKQLQLPENKVAILPEQNGVQKSKEAEENHVIKTEVNKSPTHVVMHSKLASMDDFCKVCAVSFNSPTQAQSHYQGKSHAKKLKSVESPPPVIDNNNTINQESTSP
uniref:Zinc finger matrin-type protein 3-like n=1 Tax=Saccoglossus kowalevskii TaxID=10224 RepID=A0ABM0LU38_SACKO